VDQIDIGYTYGFTARPPRWNWRPKSVNWKKGFARLSLLGGQAAISLIHLALLKAGDHVLLPESIYGPNRMFSNGVLRRFGVEVSYYPPAWAPASGRSSSPIRGLCGVRVRDPSPWKCRTCPPSRSCA